MSNLAQTILRNLKTERDMASAKGNLTRKAYLNMEIEKLHMEIEKLHRQIEEADKNERNLNMDWQMGIGE
jgi:predicted RNase H-like nuclease (RuvC/YqgF family)